MVQIRVGEGIFGADGPFVADAPHVVAVLFMVAGKLDGPLNPGVAVGDFAPHVVADFFPLVYGMPHLG